LLLLLHVIFFLYKCGKQLSIWWSLDGSRLNLLPCGRTLLFSLWKNI
jgi:hypothetical protein